MKHKIGFIGLGLIGGSIAKAIRQYYPDYEIVAFDKNKESLALATQESMIDVAATTIDNNFQNCNYIFLCAPVAYNTAYLKQILLFCSSPLKSFNYVPYKSEIICHQLLSGFFVIIVCFSDQFPGTILSLIHSITSYQLFPYFLSHKHCCSLTRC